MNILIVYNGIIPVTGYGGTERVIWYLGKMLNSMGHQITYLVAKGSSCPFAKVILLIKRKIFATKFPKTIDVVHFNTQYDSFEIDKPYIFTLHGNYQPINQTV